MVSTGVNNTWIEAGGDTPLILCESFWLQIEKLSVWFTKALLQHFSAPFLEKPEQRICQRHLQAAASSQTLMTVSLLLFLWLSSFYGELVKLPWRILGTGEPGGLPSMGSHRVGHDWSDLAAPAVKLPIYSCFVKLSFKVIFKKMFIWRKMISTNW